MTEGFLVAVLKGPVPFFNWGAVRSSCVCGSAEETGLSSDQCETRTLPHCLWLSARGCWFDEVTSGLQAEGSGDCADLGPCSENQALPFPTFSQSQSGFWTLFLTKSI